MGHTILGYTNDFTYEQSPIYKTFRQRSDASDDSRVKKRLNRIFHSGPRTATTKDGTAKLKEKMLYKAKDSGSSQSLGTRKRFEGLLRYRFSKYRTFSGKTLLYCDSNSTSSSIREFGSLDLNSNVTGTKEGSDYGSTGSRYVAPTRSNDSDLKRLKADLKKARLKAKLKDDFKKKARTKALALKNAKKREYSWGQPIKQEVGDTDGEKEASEIEQVKMIKEFSNCDLNQPPEPLHLEQVKAKYEPFRQELIRAKREIMREDHIKTKADMQSLLMAMSRKDKPLIPEHQLELGKVHEETAYSKRYISELKEIAAKDTVSIELFKSPHDDKIDLESHLPTKYLLPQLAKRKPYLEVHDQDYTDRSPPSYKTTDSKEAVSIPPSYKTTDSKEAVSIFSKESIKEKKENRVVVLKNFTSFVGLKSVLSQVCGGPLQRVVVHSFGPERYSPSQPPTQLKNSLLELWFMRPDDAQRFMEYTTTGLFLINGFHYDAAWFQRSRKYGELYGSPSETVRKAFEEKKARRCLVFKKPVPRRQRTISKHYPSPTGHYSELDTDEVYKDFGKFGQILDISPMISRKVSFMIQYYDIESSIKAKTALEDKGSTLYDKYSEWGIFYGSDPTDKPCPNV